jgi:hypothetical protein
MTKWQRFLSSWSFEKSDVFMRMPFTCMVVLPITAVKMVYCTQIKKVKIYFLIKLIVSNSK